MVLRDPSKRLEAAAIALLLALLAAALYGEHAIEGGFVGDARASRALYVYSSHDGFIGAVDFFLNYHLGARPLYAVYLVALNTVFGGHSEFWLIWQGMSCVLMSFSIYLLLRRLDFGFLDASVIATLLLIFPAASSLILWTPVIHASLAIALTALGFLIALAAFDANGQRRILLHGVSLLLFVASLLLYEITLPLMLVSFLLYILKVPKKSAARRWLVDCAVLLPFALTITFLSSVQYSAAAQPQPLSGLLPHAMHIFEESLTLLTTVVLPLSGAKWLALGAITMVPCVAAIAIARLPTDSETRSQLCRWMGVLAAGLLVIILGYAIFVPASDYYHPLATGIANRTNIVAGIGWVLMLYSLLMLCAIMARRVLRIARISSSVIAATACALIAIGWVQSSMRDADAYIASYREGERVLATVQGALPSPPPKSTIWIFGQPVEIAPGFPVFGNTWDMSGAMQLTYGDTTMQSFVGFPGTYFECSRSLVIPGGHPEYPPGEDGKPTEFASKYGKTVFVDTVSGRTEWIRTASQCESAAESFPRSPAFPEGSPSPAPSTLSAADMRLATDGGALLNSKNLRTPIEMDAVHGFIDNIHLEGQVVNLTGWAATPDLSRPVDTVVAVVGLSGLGQSVPGIQRRDVAETLDAPAIEHSGFNMLVEKSDLNCSAPNGELTVFGIVDGKASSLPLVGNSVNELNAICMSR